MGLRRRSILRAAGPGTILTIPKGSDQSQICGVAFRGIEARSPSVGLVIHGIGNFVSLCDFEGFADEAIIIAAEALVNHLEYVFADNCLRVGPRSEVNGVLTVKAPDCTLYAVEIAGGLGTRLGQILEPGQNNWCFLISGANTFMTDCVAEVGQGGIRIARESQQNRIQNTRSDLHAQHGWYIEGSRSQFSNCIALNCGLQGMRGDTPAPGWPAWYIAASAHNTFTNCRNHHETYTGNTTYGFEEFGDPVGREGNRASNNLVACTSLGHTIAPFKTMTAGPLFGTNTHYGADWLDRGGEVDVYGLAVFSARYITPTVLTDFKGTRGQRLVIVGATQQALTTIRHGPTIKTRNGEDILVQPDAAHEFVNAEGVWYQLS